MSLWRAFGLCGYDIQSNCVVDGDTIHTAALKSECSTSMLPKYAISNALELALGLRAGRGFWNS